MSKVDCWICGSNNTEGYVYYCAAHGPLIAAAPEMARLLLRVRGSIAAMVTEDADLFRVLDEEIETVLRKAGVPRHSEEER